MKGRNRRGAPPKQASQNHSSAKLTPQAAETLRRRLGEALAHHREGRLDAAEAAYRAVLSAAPRNGDALNLLGVLCLQTGRAAEAETWLRSAVDADGQTADYHDNHGSALAALGRIGEAAAAHWRAARLNPISAAARLNLANALSGAGKNDAAITALRSALVLQPDYLKAWFNLGNAHAADRRYRPAAVCFSHASALAPDWVEARANLSDALSAFGDLDGALAQARTAAAQRPEDATAHYNLGVVLQQSALYEQAELAYRAALRRRPDHLGAWNNLGGVLRRLRRPDRAAVCHRIAHALRPDFLENYYNLGNALQRLGRLHEAAAIYERVLARDPDLATATHNLGMLSLIRGDLPRGWEGYEKRFAAHEAKPDRRPPVPRWNGEPLRGRRLLIWREQGVGDEIMFASCYADLSKLDGAVTVETEPRLVGLFARSFPGLTIRAESCDADGKESIPDLGADLHIPAGSLPRLLRRRLADFSGGAWLKPDPKLAARWRTRVNALGQGLKIGICWRSQLNDEERELSYTKLPDWAPFFHAPGVRLINLQYDDCAAEIAAAEARFGCKIHRWADLDIKNDFDAAAALMSNLDLVVTVATSVGELAAAIGTPTWRISPPGDWSALGSGCRPWYDAIRTWTARGGEGLPDVLRRAAAALLVFKNAAPGRRTSPQAAAPAAICASDLDLDKLLKTAVARHVGGQIAPAQQTYRHLLTLTPDHADALHLLGLCLFQSGRPVEAARLIRRALFSDPTFATAASNLGLTLNALRRDDDAEQAFRRALSLRPDFPEACSYFGVSLQQRKQYAASIRQHRRAVRLQPDHGGFRTNLGGVLENDGQWPASQATYKQALALAPDRFPVALNNMGMAALLTGQWAVSEIWMRRALRLDGAFALAAWNLGLARLACGDLTEGWSGYEQRFLTKMLQPPRDIRLPQWRGEPLNGRRLLIWDEQGIGDQIMFGSCLEALADSDGRIVVEVDRRLIGLFARAFPWAEVRASEGSPGGPELRRPSDCDVQCPIGSLSSLFRRRLVDFPASYSNSGFLSPCPRKIAQWRDRVAALPPGLRVGIAWTSQSIDVYRRAAYAGLADWLPVLTTPGVQIVNLQYGDCAAELTALEQVHGRRLHMWDDLDLKNDLDSVAALAANLDLAITPASSVGELAAAVGTPTWRIGGHDWSKLGAQARPWFPAMRIISMRPNETVPIVLPRVARELAALARVQE